MNGPPDNPRDRSKCGSGRSPHPLSRLLAFGTRPPFEGGGDQLPDANLHCKRSFRALSRAVRAVSLAAYRVRLLRRRRASVAHRKSIRRSEYLPAKLLKVSAVFPGSAPVPGGTLAQGPGSCLFPLMLHLLYSRTARFSVRTKQEIIRSLQAPVPPRNDPPFPNSDCSSESSDEPSSPRTAVTCWFPVAAITLSVTGFTSTAETVCC